MSSNIFCVHYIPCSQPNDVSTCSYTNSSPQKPTLMPKSKTLNTKPQWAMAQNIEIEAVDKFGLEEKVVSHLNRFGS